MKLSLNVYKDGKIEKTYEADTVNLTYGTIEDLLAAIDLDKLSNADEANKFELGKMVFSLLPQIKPILKDVFAGITDEEIRRTRATELIPVFVGIFKYAFEEINSLSGDSEGN